MEDQHLFQPLKTTTSTTTTATTSFLDENDVDNIKFIIIRLLLTLFIGILSIWANYEASKGFEITILNDANHSRAGHRFALLYVSNDKATCIVLNASEFAENLLYPHDNTYHKKKKFNHVTLQLASRNLTQTVIIESGTKQDFVLHISPSVMEETDVDCAMLSAVQRGMARIWLWDSANRAPPSLLNGMVEYISILASGGFVSNSGVVKSPESGEDEDPVAVAHFLNYCEGHMKGFIQRLNQAMQFGSYERMVDDAIGLPAQHHCASYISFHSRTVDST